MAINIVRQQANIMAYNDCFYVMGFAILICGLALVFCKKVKTGGNFKKKDVYSTPLQIN